SGSHDPDLLDLRVRAAAHRMQQLIDDMLTLSRSTRGGMTRQRVDVAKIARDVLADLKSRDPTRVVEAHVPETAVVEGDARLLHIVMENLLGNAWKFTRARDPAHIDVTVTPEDGGMTIAVRDDGAGFEPTQAGRLFQPFQRLHRADEFEGTGIGLAIVRRIVNRHGGRAWAEGKPGAGATMRVWLPGVPETV
ncbi:MAG: sensor histidine kinase, partial [Myxococcota bacterium]